MSVQQVGLAAADDPAVLAWAAAEGRVLLTHDVTTMTGYAIARVNAGDPMAGIIVVPDRMAVGRAVTALADLLDGATQEQLADAIVFISIR